MKSPIAQNQMIIIIQEQIKLSSSLEVTLIVPNGSANDTTPFKGAATVMSIGKLKKKLKT